MAIIWKKAMSLGNDIIDHDHQFMVNLVNTIELILQKPEEGELLTEAFEQLYDYAVNHFRREESIQRKINYPKSIHHKNTHNTLLEQLEELKQEITDVNSSMEIKEREEEIISFLRNWLISHVLEEDMLLKPYLLKHPKGFS